VVDHLRARQSHRVRSRLHFAPGVRLRGTSSAAGFDIAALGGGEIHRTEGAYSPFLGQKVPLDVLEDVRSVAPDAPFGWSLLQNGARVTRLELDGLDVSSNGALMVTVPLEWS
jgi:hypothetical protein